MTGLSDDAFIVSESQWRTEKKPIEQIGKQFEETAVNSREIQK